MLNAMQDAAAARPLAPARPAKSMADSSSQIRVAVLLPPRPGAAVRSTPPAPPPRPASTLSPHTRDIVTPSHSGPGRPDVMSTAELLLPLEALAAAVQTPSTANISLTAPRPGTERAQNVYVDAPLKALPPPQKSASTSWRSSSPRPAAALSSTDSLSTTLRRLPPPPPVPSSSVILGASLKKQMDAVAKLSESLSSDTEDSADASIICRECGLCRCAACRTPRRLPERWLCNNACRLSAPSVVDAVSCMCVVRAAAYHCGGGEDDASDKKSPCSCGGPASTVASRWLCLGAASLVMPCLCCYLPLKCCVRGVESVYQRATDHGCRCKTRPSGLSSSSSSEAASPVISTPPLPLATATTSRHATEKRLLG